MHGNDYVYLTHITGKCMLGPILRNNINQIFLLIQICINTTSDHKLLGKVGHGWSSLVVKTQLKCSPRGKQIKTKK